MESKQVDTRGGSVVVDHDLHPLACLFPTEEITIKALQTKFLGILKNAVAVVMKEGGSTRVLSMKIGKKSPIVLRCFRRGGNKHITVVENIAPYAKLLGVPVANIADEIKQKIACSTSVDEEAKIVCGGKVFKEVWELLTKNKKKYKLEYKGLTSGAWMFGTEMLTVQLQKGIK